MAELELPRDIAKLEKQLNIRPGKLKVWESKLSALCHVESMRRKRNKEEKKNGN